jgi:hypothetical protein
VIPAQLSDSSEGELKSDKPAAPAESTRLNPAPPSVKPEVTTAPQPEDVKPPAPAVDPAMSGNMEGGTTPGQETNTKEQKQ